ncbi:MAG TPA: hypothetical protein DCS63_02655 [Elusimicrobia bacterium]|nr:hypothetical protein [Elusimicrobiota bacterium]
MAMLKTGRNSIRLDFTASYVSAELGQRMKERFTQAAGQRAAGQSGARAQPEFPSPLEISLTVLPDAKP